MTDPSDHAVLTGLRRQIREAYAAADVERAAELYVSDAVQQPPGRSPISGRAAIRQSYEALFSGGALTLEMTPWETVIAGEEGRERGAYRLAMGDRLLLAGKYMVVVRQTSPGQWRYVWTTVTPD